MLRRTLVSTLAVLAVAAAVARADDKSDLAAAIHKLADAPSYSWTTTSNSQFVRGPSDGKAEKGGYTSLNLTMQNTTSPAVIKGDKVVIKTDTGWQTPAEITAGAGDGGFNPATFIAGSMTGYKAPAEQLKAWADKLENIKKEGDAYTATLATEPAKELLMFRGRGGMGEQTVTNPKATLKLWVKDGAVSRMEVHSTGTVSFNGNDREVNRTNTTEIKDVGTTKVTVPDDAKKKLDTAAAAPATPAAPAAR